MNVDVREENAEEQKLDPSMKIEITEDGPYIVSGGIPLDEEIITKVGHHYVYQPGKKLPQSETYALCRCGHSKNPPFCDGAHAGTDFDGTETASKLPYEQRAGILYGPEVDLLDDNRCAYARFCHREEGNVWELTEQSEDPVLCEEAIKASTECPAGRLVHYDKNGEPFELNLSPRITVLQDPEQNVSAGLSIKGGIPLESADGTEYEVRNRYTLCRCGHSSNKPFCDARHINARFEA